MSRDLVMPVPSASGIADQNIRRILEAITMNLESIDREKINRDDLVTMGIAEVSASGTYTAKA